MKSNRSPVGHSYRRLSSLAARLQRAGCDRELLPQGAITLLHEATAGALRELDRIAVTWLRHAARKKRKVVGRDVVTTVLENAAR